MPSSNHHTFTKGNLQMIFFKTVFFTWVTVILQGFTRRDYRNRISFIRWNLSLKMLNYWYLELCWSVSSSVFCTTRTIITLWFCAINNVRGGRKYEPSWLASPFGDMHKNDMRLLGAQKVAHWWCVTCCSRTSGNWRGAVAKALCTYLKVSKWQAKIFQTNKECFRQTGCLFIPPQPVNRHD